MTGQADCIPSYNCCPWLGSYLGNMQQTWKPISLTHVIYPEGDLIGKLLAWASLLPIFIITSFITLIIFRRELHTMMNFLLSVCLLCLYCLKKQKENCFGLNMQMAFFLGILLNEVLNMILKYSIRSPRPCSGGDDNLLYTKYGMPSSHAQFMGFFAIYSVFFAYIRLKFHIYEKFMDNIRQHFIAFSSVGCSFVVAFSRVYLHYHTVEQVSVGLFVGVITGSTWFYIVENWLTPLFQEIANTKIAEYFLIRDSSNIPDILWFEYTASRTEARQRLRRGPLKSQ